MFAAHPDCYFQVFTNGQLITDDVARRLRQIGNVTPLVTIEGTEIISDERRGRPQVYAAVDGRAAELPGQQAADRRLHQLVPDEHRRSADRTLGRPADRDARHVPLVSHLSAGRTRDARPELALTPAQQLRRADSSFEMRATKPIGMIDAYYDDRGQALCPAATGFTHHISPWGDIEPCPIVQFAKESIHDARPLRETFQHSAFLREFRELAASSTRGCIVLERPDLLKGLVEKHGARDTTARKTSLVELDAMQPRPSQFAPGNEVPERSFVYRMVKKHFFNDFGAYQDFRSKQAETVS